MKASYKVFKSRTKFWETMCEEVSAFLTELGPEFVIGVSQSHEENLGVFTVWYWEAK